MIKIRKNKPITWLILSCIFPIIAGSYFVLGQFNSAVNIAKPSLHLIYTTVEDLNDVPGSEVTTFWTNSINDLNNPKAIASVHHSDGFPLRASLSPDGSKIAYAVLPEWANAKQRSKKGEIWLLDLRNGYMEKIADGCDSDVAPVWSTDSTQFFYEINYLAQDTESLQEYRLYNIFTKTNVVLTLPGNALDNYPLFWSRNGKLFYFQRILPGGDELWALELKSGQAMFVLSLSHQIAKSVTLSPNGREIVGLVLDPASHTYSLKAMAIDGSEKSTILESNLDEDTYLSWLPNGLGLSLNTESSNSVHARVVTISTTPKVNLLSLGTMSTENTLEASSGPIFPLSWSPDGKWLLIEQFQSNRYQILVVDESSKKMRRMAEESFWEFLGWIVI